MTSSESAPARWRPPEVVGPAAIAPTADELQALQRAAHQEAWAQGHQEGLAAGRAAAVERVARLDHLLAELAAPLAVIDERLEQELAALVAAVARQLVRRELQSAPAQIIAVVRESLAVLPLGAAAVSVQLHPEDAALVRELLPAEEPAGARRWQLVEEPTLGRGDCRVSSADSEVDARLETRLGSVISEVLGGARAADDGGQGRP